MTVKKQLKKAALGLIGSRKFMAAVISGGVWAAGKFGLHLSAAELIPVVGPLWGYIASMVGADWGKHKAEIEAAEGKSSDA